MSLYGSIPLLIVVAILQSTLAPRLIIGGVRFELMLLVVISWTLRRGLSEGVVWAFCGGLALDLLSGAPLGTCTLALIVSAVLAGSFSGTLVRSRAALPWLMAALTTAVYYGILLLVLRLTGQPVDAQDALLRHILPAMAYNVVVVTVVYAALTWVDRRMGEPELRW